MRCTTKNKIRNLSYASYVAILSLLYDLEEDYSRTIIDYKKAYKVDPQPILEGQIQYWINARSNVNMILSQIESVYRGKQKLTDDDTDTRPVS